MNNVIEKLKTTRILGVIGIVGLILGTITPYVEYRVLGHVYSLPLSRYWQGKVVIVLAIVNALFIFKDLLEKYIPSLFNTEIGKKIQNLNNPKYSLIATALSAIFAIYLTILIRTELTNYGLGFYLLWIGTICLVAYAFLHKKENESV